MSVDAMIIVLVTQKRVFATMMVVMGAQNTKITEARLFSNLLRSFVVFGG